MANTREAPEEQARRNFIVEIYKIRRERAVHRGDEAVFAPTGDVWVAWARTFLNPMKSLMIVIALALPAFATFETWTNKDGREARMEFVKLAEKDGEKAVEFKLGNGHHVVIKADTLSEEDLKRLPAEPTVAAPAANDVFGGYAKKGLVKLDRNQVNDYVAKSAPKKYYLLYYSASWCGPCRQVTPLLVKWYNENKTDDFELILVGNDQSNADMKKYMKDDTMPWPAFDFPIVAKEDGFGKYRNPGGIPRLSVVKLDGTLVTCEHPARLLPKLKELLAK